MISGDFLGVVEEECPLLFAADVMFPDANTWHPAEWTWRQSILGNLSLVDKWRPRRTYLLHYSGYEDGQHQGDSGVGPMNPARLGEQLRQLAGQRDIQPAVHGMVLGNTVSILRNCISFLTACSAANCSIRRIFGN